MYCNKHAKCKQKREGVVRGTSVLLFKCQVHFRACLQTIYLVLILINLFLHQLKSLFEIFTFVGERNINTSTLSWSR
jgi:hypothetical protein